VVWETGSPVDDFVLGSLYTTAKVGSHDPEARLRIVLEAAERYSTGVAGPFRFVRTPDVAP
jgi:hypothetical protein